MSGDGRAASTRSPSDGGEIGFLRRMLRLLTPWGVKRAVQLKFEEIDASIGSLQSRLDSRLDAIERRLDEMESAQRRMQAELAEVRDRRLTSLETRSDRAEQSLGNVSEEMERLRDGVIPAAVARSNVLLDRLAEELEETTSLVERALRSEPLPVASASPIDVGLVDALADIQPRLLEAFRGTREEIGHRLDHYLADLRSRSPVLDLGCGRGELLLLLREAGVEATGVEVDSALAGAAARRGLRVVERDVLEGLRSFEDGAWGAVTALHLFEHLVPNQLSAVLAETHRVLRPGGLLIAECPNPHSLRVGGTLFWQDPTHVRPLLPETLEIFMQAAGFEVIRHEALHPFPGEQMFASIDGPAPSDEPEAASSLAVRVDRISGRLDEILNAPRDCAVWATKPSARSSA